MSKKVYDLELFGQTIRVETGELAKQASGSVLVRYGDTAVLSTAAASKEEKNLPFFPLTVAFEEKLYSVGKIPGGFLRREGRPSEHATLTSRLIDRTIRPLFPEGFRNDVQVINTVLSVDLDYSADLASMLGSSLALSISEIPFSGPVAGVQVGRIDGEFVINPTQEEMEKSSLDLIVAGTEEAINMVEAGAEEVSEEIMVEAMMFGHRYVQEICRFQKQIIEEVAKEKMEVNLHQVPEDITKLVEESIEEELREAVAITKKQERADRINEVKAVAIKKAEEDYKDHEDLNKILGFVDEAVEAIVADEVRRLISVDKIRPDGRKAKEIRPLDVQIDLLNRAHGSGLFTRGETQVLSVATLGAMGDIQVIDDLSDVEAKRFMHHYNFPPFCVGETGRIGAPNRREIGHGALAERALSYVIPSEEEFPYAIRVVSEVLESNGSSSQASICASSLALMAAGVPVKSAVSGIAMGMVKYGDDYTILSDIQGMEDFYGDMDFKVAGTEKGITALQMDIKIDGLGKEILSEALSQAHEGRMEILEAMNAVIDTPKDQVSQYAPKIEQMQIDPEKIRDVIGSGGKVINKIIEEADDVQIDIEDDGRVVIYHTDQAAIDKAKAMVENIVREAKVGEIYDAKVVRIEKFGAFVELFEGTDALLHISKLEHRHVNKVEDIVKIGDRVKVKVIEIDHLGRVNVSRKALLPKPEKETGDDERRRPNKK